MLEAYEKALHEMKQTLAGFVEEAWDAFVKHCQAEGIEAPSAYGFKEWLMEQIEQ